MANLFGSIPLVSGLGSINWMNIIAYGMIFIIGLVAVGAVIFMMIYVKKYQITPIREIDIFNNIIKYRGKVSRNKNTKSEKMYIARYKKYIPRPQEEDLIKEGKKKVLYLFKDNNGLLHPMRRMSYEDLNFFFKAKGIDITEEFITKTIEVDGIKQTEKVENPMYKYHQFYFMPNPNEDLEWLGKECEEANKEYSQPLDWKTSPVVMVVGTAFVCMIMVLVTLLLRNKIG